MKKQLQLEALEARIPTVVCAVSLATDANLMQAFQTLAKQGSDSIVIQIENVTDR